jgi:hypothetical protein
MYAIFLLPLIILVAGILFTVAGNRTKERSTAMALKVVGLFLIFCSVIFFAGCFALIRSFRDWN